MRRLWPVLALVAGCLAWSAPAAAQVTVRGSCGPQSHSSAAAQATSTSCIVTATAGDSILTFMGVEGPEACTFTDDKGNSYAPALTLLHANNSVRVCVSWAHVVAAGATTVIAQSSASQYQWMGAVAVSPCGVVGTPGFSQGTSDAVTGPSVTASGAGLTLGVFATIGGVTITTGAGWTLLQKQENSSWNTGASAYRTSAAGVSYQPLWSLNDARPYVSIAVPFTCGAAAAEDGVGDLVLLGHGL